ncbi:hypothetical protein FA13DRAFT_1799510 [Coprinellus micaceus]|uniref:F-box domain-containing protein n=1 Tax=Coprinellus micaceus TaxID=71717 RepID=A0A4Y7SIS5_COPMI|nr:hypothetical protein FA13DRAFT_1799510 [Coprinellus micaceus]
MSIYMHTKRLRLKSLEAASTSGPGKTERVVLPYLLSQAWDHLKSLTLDWCRPELMDHLASLPRLQNLAFKEFGTDLLTPLAQGQPTISPSAFQLLRVLSVHPFDSRGPIRHLLKWIPPSNEICELRCSVVVASKTARRQDTIHDISRFCNPCTLGHLSSTDGGLVPGDFGYLWQEEEPIDPDEAEDVDISSLYQFTSLRSLMLLWNFSHIRLTHQDASLISTSWPLIQCLDLCPRYPSYGRIPGIDHTDLLKILGGCPSLRYLGLRFDATRIKGHDDNDSVSATSRLKILEVGE